MVDHSVHDISGAFANADETIIGYKCGNYYRACDARVSDLPDGGSSHCVKRVGHPGTVHEDFAGRSRVNAS